MTFSAPRSWNPRIVAGAALGVLAFAAPSGFAATSTAPSHATVVIRDIGFHARTVAIRRGGSVTWEWRDGAASMAVSHTVTSVSRLRFRSADARNHGRYVVRFPKPGSYAYECTIHIGMTGRVLVR